MSRHTPGPWRVSPVANLSSSGRSALYRLDNLEAELHAAARAREHGGGTLRTVWPQTEYPANARLIAAAPDLLEALQLARDLFVNSESACAEICDAAIAKATESP